MVRTVTLLVLELLFCVAVCVGIWMIFPPAALIVGGIAGVVVLERLPDVPKKKAGAR